ncbi:MAG: YlxR family protein [Scytolyngbya sp. HA4215-MV1]|jgi:hypothetical protein|nr:YlxR family protein [Scytolyngbya sp. HA4215-MV1]
MQPNYRRCLSCRKVAPKEAFLRLVRIHPSHTVVLDRGMGRSAYLCPEKNCLQMARKKNKLDRALKASVPAEIHEMLWQRISYTPQSE